MSLRMGALYDALIAAKVPEEQARKASEEVADYSERIRGIETDLAVLKWMVGFVLAFMIANLWFSVTILGRLPR